MCKVNNKFKIQQGGTYDGMPLFDGKPEHINEWLDTYLEYVGLEGAALYATDSRMDYVLVDEENPNKGKTIPGSAQAHDHVQGVSTDFPTIGALGQSWNNELVERVGQVIVDEHLSTVDYADTAFFNPTAYSAVADVRINPLIGRIDESFSEDPVLAGKMAASMSAGYAGTNTEESQNSDKFWTKCIMGSKHYPNYGAEWARRAGSKYAGIRGLMEYQIKSFFDGIKQGSIMSVMTSYGCTNGIPNIISPMIPYAQKYAKWGLMTSPDFNSFHEMVMEGVYSNGYDQTYIAGADKAEATANALAVYQASNSAAGWQEGEGTPMQLVRQIRKGVYGISEKDVYETARMQLTQLVRVGLFNERDEQNNPIGYPFLSLSKNHGGKLDYHILEHQKIALQSAEESIVLLKNDNNVLPIDKKASLLVTGGIAEARFKSTYSVPDTPDIKDAGLTPKEALYEYSENKNGFHYERGTKIVALRSMKTGKYLSVGNDLEGGVLSANGFTRSMINTQFELYDWGQEGYSIKSILNQKWLKGTRLPVPKDAGWGVVGAFDGIKNTGNEVLNAVKSNWDNGFFVGISTDPEIFRIEENEDGTVSILYHCHGGGFLGGNEIAYYKEGQYLTVTEDGTLNVTDILKDKETAISMRTDSEKFLLEEIKSMSTLGEKYEDKDYAIVVTGIPSKFSNSEGSDRSDLAMGKEQYKLVADVAENYPGRTIVIIKSNVPVLMEEIHNNENVAAILYQPYAGQYDGYALARLIFGDAVPTGKLTGTWYASMDALPDMDEAMLHGLSVKSMDELSPRYTKDFTNNDPEQTGLTYMYTEADVTYSFGYGLTYTTFEYSNLQLGEADAEGNFEVNVDITNSGDVDSSEIVQLYITNRKSIYGTSAPKQKLVGYAKRKIKAGETVTVSISVTGDSYAVWSTNDGDYVVESGTYIVKAASSSTADGVTREIKVQSGEISTLDISDYVNVAERSFTGKNVFYTEISKVNTIKSLLEKKVLGNYSAVVSKKEGAYTALANVDLDDVKIVRLQLAGTEGGCVELRLDAQDGKSIASVDFSSTAEITKELPGGILTKELGYTEVSAELSGVTGVHNLYLICKNKGIRIASIKLE